ncbi:hypothetical protein RM780_05185 [Streptomyces sp. DSM 44917]|uniref:DUF1449 domain-containing protein n=1 Tax=Streptomyces boetiae TaxID=3075541 RepID=A0ABU2L468_9ACTN|nr:hypothetical protein [Streptomyces sp. DSM 44917]MDT0306354.1 hypothetical protein [Streptomyces sp. DSM 44917]
MVSDGEHWGVVRMPDLGDFAETALSFPAAVLTFPLAVVLLYWIFSVVFGVGASVGEDAAPGGEGGAFAGALALAGLGGVPPALPVSLVIAVGWFVAMAGTELLDPGWPRVATLPVALLAGWAGAAALVRPLRRAFAAERGIYHEDFVGRVCVIRTGRVTDRFGQAEVTADDGGTSVVQVRAEGPEAAELGAGRRALIFGYEPEGQYFWVAPYDSGESSPGENRALA